jgi:hypothetical protein
MAATAGRCGNASPALMAATNKCLVLSNKSGPGDERPRSMKTQPTLVSSRKPTIKIRFTEPQIALVMHAHPNCNLDHLSELSFEFDQSRYVRALSFAGIIGKSRKASVMVRAMKGFFL